MKNYRITVNGNSYDVGVQEISGGVPIQTSTATAPSPAPVVAKPAATPKANATGTKVTAPMPGKILAVKVEVGQAVKKGAVLVTLEAMKMENEIISPIDGKVEVVSVSKGSNVESGDLLVSIV